MNKKNRLYKIALLAFGLTMVSNSCSNDFVDREFRQDVIQSDLKTLQEIKSFVRGGYSSMRSSTYYGRDFLAFGEVRSDEMYSNKASGYYTTVQDYSMTSTDAYASGTYNQIYTLVGKMNIVINTDLTGFLAVDLPAAKYYQGQAYALRAQGFFDLLRLYGQKYTGASTALGVVLPLKFDPKAKQARATIAQTETQIESDFNTALTMMTANAAIDAPSNKTELSISALKVLMSRYYLYKGDYAKVRSLTADVIGKYSVIPKDLYQESFRYTLRGAASNSIFELEVGTDSSLSTSSYAYVMSYNGYANVVPFPSVYAMYDAADIRRTLITRATATAHYLSYTNGQGVTFGKYTNTVGADNIKMIRYEEVLLNAIEAELMPGGDPAKALLYYNQILTNRGLTAVTSVDLDMLKKERVKELVGEGFRQWDLLRWGVTSFKPASVNINKLAFPIPRAETDLAGTLVVSNPGYDN